jgi:hypothetical protein
MYNLNPAVIKSILSNLPKDQFILHARFIRRKAFTNVPGTNLHAMFVNLYRWCRATYRVKYLQKIYQANET